MDTMDMYQLFANQEHQVLTQGVCL